ncbi:MAG: LamG-like jellyroll fold domain-containing protein [Ferruginibacter sp.]
MHTLLPDTAKKIPSLFLFLSFSFATYSQAPQAPTNITPLNGTTNYANNTVSVTVTDPNGDPLTVKLYGRKKICNSTAPNFSIIGLPDTQFYTEEVPGTNSAGGGHNGIFKAQTQWIADHRIDSNIAFVVQLGDCVQNGDTPPGSDDQIEWKRVDTSIKNIEFPNVPIADGIPYGLCVGNHDQSVNGSPNSASNYYNQYFGAARFAGRGYNGGQYGANRDNHFELFSSGGIDFIHISIEYYPNANAASLVTLQPILDWADSLLKSHPARKGLISSHNLLNTANNFQGPGQKIYDDLKDNPNLFLMLAGHVPGEGRRSDTYNGNTIYTVMSDYQNGYTNGGNGYLRIMEFKPAENIITVKTYSPYSNTSFTGATSQFSLPFNFPCPFTLIGTNTAVASGSSSTFTWPALQLSTDYEWYVTIDDGKGNLTSSSISAFRTWNGTADAGTGSLSFYDTNYIDFGDATELKLTDFTLEAWVKIEGYGSTTESGTGGLTKVVPIITKGRAEAESAAVDVNYFLGYESGTNKLVADFEDNVTSLNHPVTSTATIPMNTWTHVGASFDVATKTWRLFIGDAVEPFVLPSTFMPQSLSEISVCIGSTLNTPSTSIRAGSFNGRIDEVRIWNTALTTLNPGELTSGTGLVGRWGFGDGSGSGLSNSISGGANGTIINNYEWVTGYNEADTITNACIDFNGVHDYVTFGAAPSLNTTASATGFTLEGWVKIEGQGIATSTGTLGLVGVVPIIAKGTGENEASGLNINYFMGFEATTKMLVADFEEGAGTNTGLNHPITGTTALPVDVWTHVAATYNITDGAWNLYINGKSAGTGNAGAGRVPENISVQHASIGSALTSGGVAGGFFNGKIDEVRIWKRALTQAEIQVNLNNEITGGTGLLGRWGFNENGDSTIMNSISGAANGILRSTNPYTHATNGGPAWVSTGFIPTGTAITTTATATPAIIVFEASSVTLMATLSPNPGGGTVQFYVDGIAVGGIVSINTVTGTATLTTYNPSSLAAGEHTVRADFQGFGIYTASTGANGMLTVIPNPLPVRFSSIKAYGLNKDIAVEWNTENELNIKQYAVEKSTDGLHFSPATTLFPKANNNGSASYQWIDLNGFPGYNYYRIKSIGINGQVQYSNIVKFVMTKETSQFMIYPNPVTEDNINLQFINQPKGKYLIRLMNKSGQVIMMKQIEHRGGSNTETLKAKMLSHVTYQLVVTKPDNTNVSINMLNR